MSTPRSKDMKLNPGTFGGSPACHILVDMMNKNMIPVKEKHRVLAFINAVIIEFKAIKTIVPPPKRHGYVDNLLVRSRNYHLAYIDKWDYPEIFRTILKNVIHYQCKRFLKEEA
jgi:hypothetical protein